MKKTLHIIAFAAVAIAALTSCAKEEFKENAIPAGEPIEVSLNGQIGEFTPADATKATAESVVRVTWGSGDKVYVYDGSASIGTLTVTPDENNASYAMLSGTITASGASPAPTKLTLVYVKSATAAPAITGGKISIDLSSQNQTEVPFVLYTTVAYDAAALTKTNEYISFTFATSVMTVNCTGLQTGSENAVIGISKAEIDGVSTVCELAVTGSGVTVAGAKTGKITRTDTAEPSVFTQSDSRGSFKLALAADPATPAARNILVHQGSKVSGAPFTTTTLAAGKSYNTVYQMGEYIAPPAGILPGEFTIANGKKIHFSKGNLYAKKDNGTWTWHFYDNQYGYNSLNSQCEDGSRAATEGDTEIDLFTWGYDAEYSINPIGEDYVIGHATDDDNQLSHSDDWGYVFGGESSVWRTLSIAEWRYLFAWTPSGVNTDTDSPRYNLYKYGVTVCGKENCVVLLPDDWKWEGAVGTGWQEGGYPETSTDKVTWQTMEDAGAVCISAAGSRNIASVNNVGGSGYYWSSSANDVEAAFYVTFSTYNDDDVNLNYSHSRFGGCSVRLVTEASSGYAPELPEVPVESISLSKTELELIEGLSESLTITFTPAEPTKKAVFWSSDNTSVATVDQTGKVSAVSVGTATITAVADGLAKASCAVTVSGLPNNVIIYKAAEKLEDFDPGVAFGDNNTISDHSFADGVGTIEFASKVTLIDEEAFSGCAMTYVGIPASVKEIGYEAFYECEELEQVFIAGGSELETIGEEAFMYSALTSFNIPASVTKIDMAFCGCENLTKVTFANDCAITSIGVCAFGECGFTSITIPASVTKIGQSAFYESALTSINISASVTEIGDSAFEGCNSLAEVTFADDCNITSIGVGVFAGCGFTSITIPATVTTIGESAFSYSALTSVNIPSSVTVIGEQAFYGCEDLTTVTFADNSQFTEIGYRTFYQSGLTSINIPASVKEIGEEAFYECEDLATLTFADNSQLTKIGAEVFFGSGLTSIKIPALVTEIGGYAFGNCEDLATVTFASGSQLSTIDILFDGSGLKSITIPASVTEIKDKAFMHLSKLTTVTFENNSRLTKIGESVFYQSGLTSINIPASVTEIGDEAFFYCEDLTTVTFEDNSKLTQIGVHSFEGSGLTSVNIPTLVTEIGDYAFEDCEKLATVTFEDNSKLTQIGAGSFRRSGLESVNIPFSVTTISEYAFCECESLDVIKVNWTSAEQIPSIKNKYVFDDVDASNRKLYVPSGKVETYINADKGWNDVTLGTITDGTD